MNHTREMNKAIVIFVSALWIASSASAQYYYKDILVSQQTQKHLQQMKAQKFRSVQVVSFENTGQVTEDFDVQQTYNGSYTQLVTTTRSTVANESRLVTQFDAQGRVSQTYDTTDGFSSTTRYQYDEAGKLILIDNISISAGQSEEREIHRWVYNASGQPEKMTRIKNGIDTITYSFVLDENGNVAEENAARKGTSLQSVYYYYDSKNRLTDIVRFNEKARRLLPDYMFEYNDRDQPTSMVVIPEGSDDYQRWIYQYNENGLKRKETAMNKRRQILGTLEYRYQ